MLKHLQFLGLSREAKDQVLVGRLFDLRERLIIKLHKSRLRKHFHEK